MKLKFKKGDVLVVKKNTTCGFATGTVVRVVDVHYNEVDYKSYIVELLDGSKFRYHDQKDLRKIKERLK